MLLQLSSLKAAGLGLKSERKLAKRLNHNACNQQGTAQQHYIKGFKFKVTSKRSHLSPPPSPHFGLSLVASYYYTSCYARLCDGGYYVKLFDGSVGRKFMGEKRASKNSHAPLCVCAQEAIVVAAAVARFYIVVCI